VAWWQLAASFYEGGGRLGGLLGAQDLGGTSLDTSAASAAWPRRALGMVLVGVRKPGRRPRALEVLPDIDFRQLRVGGRRSGASRPGLDVGPCRWC
jgi:hypothetical protein